jgi:hypothetical protein
MFCTAAHLDFAGRDICKKQGIFDARLFIERYALGTQRHLTAVSELQDGQQCEHADMIAFKLFNQH